jgi:alpha-amylase/alpha-mannosidase (GH57 family)
MMAPSLGQICIHGHFYQPPRADPWSGEVPSEQGAEPYHDFNAKITAECYRPNTELGNFSRISFDLGPTLASWLERYDRPTYRRILAQERMHYQRHGCSNALAQVYSHAIMPLATERERRIQVAWGLADYEHRFGHEAPGIWLAETAADRATLATLADFGVGFTVLSPWQADEPVDPTQPYWVDLPDGRTMTVFFYDGPLSGGVSFDAGVTTDAASFSSTLLPGRLSADRLERNEQQLVLVATDGELYGHHQPLRQHFLHHLLRISAPAAGFEVTTLARYLQANPPRQAISLIEPSSWSCAHGVDRWSRGCSCTGGDSNWKAHLRAALDTLAVGLDAQYEVEASELLLNPWAAEEEFIQVRLGRLTPPDFLRRQARRPFTSAGRTRIFELLEAQYYRHLMLASCAFFFDDLDRIEPRNSISYGLRALCAVSPAPQAELLARFEAELALARSGRTGRTGAQMLRAAIDRRGARSGSGPAQAIAPVA